MHVTLFGPTTVTEGGRQLPVSVLGGTKPRQILEILAISGTTPVPKDQLAELLWEGGPPRSAMGTLESYVCLLRKGLGLGRGRDSALRTVMHGYVLDEDSITVDVTRFRRLVEVSGAALASSDRAAALDALQQAVALVRGGLLASEAYASWAVREREIFQRELVVATTLGARHALAAHDTDQALRFAEMAVATDGLAEEAVRLQMQALRIAGRRSEALRSYADLRERLRVEIGAEPSPESERLYLEVLQGGSREGGDPSRPSREEARILVRLLREALSSIPPTSLREDHDLTHAVAGLLTAV